MTITRPDTSSTSAFPRRATRSAPTPSTSTRTIRPPTSFLKTDAGLEGHGLTFTIGRGNEVVRRRDRGVPASRRRAAPRRHHGGLRRLLAQPGGRFAAALAGAGERRHASGAGGRRERRLGPLRQGRAETGVEAARGHDAGAAGVLHRLPPHHGRAHAGRGAGDSRTAGAVEGGARGGAPAHRLSRPTPPRSAGWDTTDEKIRTLVQRSAGRGLDPLQGEGGRQAGRRSATRRGSCARRSARATS